MDLPPTSLIDLGLDFETYYDSEYTLRKLQNAQYVLDERFDPLMYSFRLPGMDTAHAVKGDFETLKTSLAQFPWERIRVISHNARFDGSILEWRFGFRPAKYLCTMVGSRPHFVPKTGSASLESIANHLNLGQKGNAVKDMIGKRLADLNDWELAKYMAYCGLDTDLAWGISRELLRIMPDEELELIDLTLKKYLRPKLLLDDTVLRDRSIQIETERQFMLTGIWNDYQVSDAQLRSRNKFAELLKQYGIEAPMKLNKKGQRTFAFAKDDQGMKELVAHPDEKIRRLSAAKLVLSSSMEGSRITRLIDLAHAMRGWLPVPMVYYGAHTGRFSGDAKINLQNLPRVDKDKKTKLIKKGHLRFAIKAPPEYSIIAADFSNIEARIVATLAEEWGLVKQFANKDDVYSNFATQVYGYKVDKINFPDERFVGKTCVLGLGYGMGWLKFLTKMLQENQKMDEKEAKRIVYLYRELLPGIPGVWKLLDQLAQRFIVDPTGLYVWKGLTFAYERIILPNGMPIMYPDLKYDHANGLSFRSRKFAAARAALDDDDDSVVLEIGTRIWGGHFLENISQGIARIIATRAELELTRYGLPVSMQSHDELIFRVPTKLVSQCIPVIESVMTKRVDFMPELPIAVEINHGPTYGDAK